MGCPSAPVASLLLMVSLPDSVMEVFCLPSHFPKLWSQYCCLTAGGFRRWKLNTQSAKSANAIDGRVDNVKLQYAVFEG